MKLSVCLFATVFTVTPLVATMQTPTPATPDVERATFDVVSIKRNNGTGGMGARTVPGSFSVYGVPVRFVVRQAYAAQDFQITGGPDWMDTDLFDIEARFDPGTSPTGPRAMAARLRNMLRDRFDFLARTEVREMPIYALVRARQDRLGPRIKPSAVDCTGMPAPGRQAGPGPDGRPVCGGRGRIGEISAGGLTMAQLAAQLSQYTGRLIVDKTGLAGSYTFDLSWNPMLGQAPPTLPPGVAFPFNADAPSLIAALEEQLGLTLDSQRGPVEMVVVERLEAPTGN